MRRTKAQIAERRFWMPKIPPKTWSGLLRDIKRLNKSNGACRDCLERASKHPVLKSAQLCEHCADNRISRHYGF